MPKKTDTVDAVNEDETRAFEEPNDPFDDDGEDTSSAESELIDSILRTEPNPDDIAERQSALTLEPGMYRWVPGQFKVDVNFSSNDIDPHDLAQQRGVTGKGRCFIKITGVVINANNRKGRFEFSCSPDKRYKDGELDFFSKFYAQAEALYFKVKEKNPKAADVKDMLESGEYQMYITRGQTRNFFKNFQPLSK